MTVPSSQWALLGVGEAPGVPPPLAVLTYPAGYFLGALALAIQAQEPPPPPPPPILFEVELASWIASTLGVDAYPLRLPQDVTAYPALAYTLVDGDSLLRLSGPAGQAWRDYQFDCYAPTYVDALGLDDRLRKALQALVGPMGRITIQEANRHRPSAFYESPPDGSDDGIHRFMSEYTLWYLEP